MKWNEISLLLAYAIHKMRNWTFSCKIGKKMYKRLWHTCKVVVWLIKPFASLKFSSPSCCWILKSLMFPAKQDGVMPFDVGITWMPMLNGKANGCLQWFLSLCSMEKPLFAGHRCNKHVQWNPNNSNLDNSNSPQTQTKSYFPWISLHFQGAMKVRFTACHSGKL